MTLEFLKQKMKFWSQNITNQRGTSKQPLHLYNFSTIILACTPYNS